MNAETFATLEQVQQTQGAAATIDSLIATLRQQENYHQLFDALLMKKKLELGAPLTRPTSLDDVPVEQRIEFEKAYVDSAREVGELLLASGQIGQAWMYLRTIREPAKIAAALEQIDPQQSNEELIEIALYHGVAPVKGLQMMLSSHGTCSSITALDQQFANLPVEHRHGCAALLVRRLYDDLRQTLQSEVTRKQGLTPPGQSVHDLIAGRDWIFADGNYHIDVSHLHAVIKFSRYLTNEAPELKLATELAEYGSRLSEQYQYAGDPPFEDYYTAHTQWFKTLSSNGREGLDYFREKLNTETGATEIQLAALAFIDLATRVGKMDEALEVAEQHLAATQDQYGFSFTDLCTRAGRYDTLRKVARDKDDVVTFTAALLAGSGQGA